jgi:hypothetical protein
LAPLLAEDATFVCLQHDATDEEREFLNAHAKNPVRYIDEFDARDDFEELAALVAALDLVTGIGTTVVNLAAGVGTRTIMMQPSHFSTWLSERSGGTNFWYGSCEVVYSEPPWDIPSLVDQTRSHVRNAINGVAAHGDSPEPRVEAMGAAAAYP